MNIHKNAFLNKYNPTCTIDKAIASAINASVQHNSLYRKDISSELKVALRHEWRWFLMELVPRYSNPQELAEYEADIEELKRMMNLRFSQAFNEMPHPKFKTDPGFRISHAQKSIAVFLKHAWCMGMIATPPQCPVDAIILTVSGRRYPETKWGYVNTIDEHRCKIKMLELAKADPNVSLAEWELAKFKP